VVRHPFIHYPDDPAVLALTYQYLIGSELMVAPVLDPNRDAVAVYLPAGEWIHVWSGERFGRIDQGTHVTVDAPLGEPAIFYPVGSAVGEQFANNLKALDVLVAAAD
jgi:alpha-glucosidase